MRTVEEIVHRLRNRMPEVDLLGFRQEALAIFLPKDALREFLKAGATAEDWTPLVLTAESVQEEMRKYMAETGWPKVLNHRGISAGRTVEKMAEWLWLLGDDELYRFAEADENFAQYGAPVLLKICQKYGFQIPDGPEANRMALGLECRPGCDEGCGG